MRMDKRSWIISGAVFALALAFTVFCGISITNMTDSGKNAENESEEIALESGETEDEADTAPSLEEPSSEEAVSEAPQSESAGSTAVTRLTQEELDTLLANYDNTVQTYYASGERDSENRAQSCFTFEDQFLLNGLNVRIFNDYTKHRASLTFILLYEGGYTEKLLDELSELSVKATFFICQNYAASYPDIINRMISEGHVIGSVGASNAEGGLANYGLIDQMNDIANFDDFMMANYNYKMNLFYPAYDTVSICQAAMVEKMGYTYCLYSANYMDYDATSVIDTEAFREAMTGKAHNGVIYSFHTCNSASIDIIPGLINDLQAQEYEIVLID